MTTKHPEVIFKIQYSKSEPPFQLKYSANAWWMNPYKIARLITYLELGKSLPKARAYADITHRQYRYFLQVHPQFNLVRNHVAHRVKMGVVEILEDKVSKDGRLALKYLERTDPEYYGKKRVYMPWCDYCKMIIPEEKIPQEFRSSYNDLYRQSALKKVKEEKFEVKPEKPKKVETPEEKEARLVEVRAKKKIDDGLKEQQRKYDAYKKRHPEVSEMHFWPPIRGKS